MKKLLSIFLILFTLKAAAQTDLQEIYQNSLENKNIIIDAREVDEIRPGMVKNAKWFPLSKISQDPNWLVDFKSLTKDKAIFLYCRSGARSGKVQDILKSHGIESTNIGGFMDLKNKLPTEPGKP